MTATDQELFAQATGGDVDAVGDLLRRHGPAARRNISGRIPRQWQSVVSEDDVMQQTYADAFRSIGRFEPTADGSFAGWLTSLARCNLRDATKMLEAEKRGGGRRRVEAPCTDESYVALYDLLAASGTTPSRHAAREEARAALKEAIQQLPDAYRTLVQLYDLEGQSIESVAQALNRSPGAVYMLRARAHSRLGEILGGPSDFLSGSS